MRKHLLFVATAASGHINPTLPLVEALIRRGHRVTYPVPDAFTDQVRRTGADVVPAPPLVFGSGGPRGGKFEFTAEVVERMAGGFADGLGAKVEPLVERFADAPPDAVCYTSMAIEGAAVAGILGVPGIQLYPSYASNEHYAVRDEFLPTDAEPRAAVLEAMERVAARLRSRAEELGVRRDIGGFFAPPPEDLNLVFIPREFQYAGDTFDGRYHFIGPSRRTDSAAGWEPPTGDRRLLFISLGTAFNTDADFFRRCLEAFGDTDWDVAMAIGTKVTAADLGTVPDNFDVRPFFPQQAVLEHAAAFITHAGMNSVMEGGWHQVPMAAVPQMPEQAANARRISELDLGTVVGDGGLREAVDAVVGDPKIKVGLAAVRRAVDDAGGADAGVDAIEKYLLR